MPPPHALPSQPATSAARPPHLPHASIPRKRRRSRSSAVKELLQHLDLPVSQLLAARSQALQPARGPRCAAQRQRHLVQLHKLLLGGPGAWPTVCRSGGPAAAAGSCGAYRRRLPRCGPG